MGQAVGRTIDKVVEDVKWVWHVQPCSQGVSLRNPLSTGPTLARLLAWQNVIAHFACRDHVVGIQRSYESRDCRCPCCNLQNSQASASAMRLTSLVCVLDHQAQMWWRLACILPNLMWAYKHTHIGLYYGIGLWAYGQETVVEAGLAMVPAISCVHLYSTGRDIQPCALHQCFMYSRRSPGTGVCTCHRSESIAGDKGDSTARHSIA